jgi:ABC-type transport system involved in multi-copper enzyme maturation permease subunit
MGLHYFLLVFVLYNITDLASSINYSDNQYGQIDFSLVPVFQFPDIWHNITYISGFFKILLGIFMVISVTNEFQYNTVRMNISNGLSRVEFLASKFILSFLIAIVSGLVILFSGLLIGIAKSNSEILINLMDKTEFIAAYFLEILLYLVYAIFIAVWLRKSGISIVILLIYPLLVEPLIRWRFPDHIDQFFPIKAMDQLIVFPFPKYVGVEIRDFIDPMNFVIVLGWIGLLMVCSYLILKKRNL